MFNRFMLTAAMMLGATSAAASDSPEIDSKAVVRIEGMVDGEVLSRVDALVKQSETNPVDELQILINSPGGYVGAGMVFINMMELLRTRGTEITCFVPQLAASMAFQILAHCDNRYALAGALLLWHPVRVTIFMAALAPADTERLNTELTRVEERLVSDLKPRLGIADKPFFYHYLAETLFTAPEVNALAGKTWIKIVDNMPGLMKLLPSPASDDAPDEDMLRHDWMFVYRMPERKARE